MVSWPMILKEKYSFNRMSSLEKRALLGDRGGRTSRSFRQQCLGHCGIVCGANALLANAVNLGDCSSVMLDNAVEFVNRVIDCARQAMLDFLSSDRLNIHSVAVCQFDI